MLNLLRKRLAKPEDIFVINFGVWHTKQGEAGWESYRLALKKLGEDRQVSAVNALDVKSVSQSVSE